MLLRQPVEPSEDHLLGTISLVQSSRLPAHPLVLNVVLAEYRHDGDINVCVTHRSPPESKRLFYTSVSLLLSCIQCYESFKFLISSRYDILLLLCYYYLLVTSYKFLLIFNFSWEHEKCYLIIPKTKIF